MPQEFQSIVFLSGIFIIIILFGLIAAIILWVKSKSKAFAWFTAQIVFLMMAFFNAVELIPRNYNPSKAITYEEMYPVLKYSLGFGAFSMLCMFIGVFMLYSEISRLKNPWPEKQEYLPSIKKSIGLLIFYELLVQIVLTLILLIASSIINFNMQDPLLTSALTIGGLMLTVKYLRRKHVVDIKGMFNLKRVKVIHFIPITLSMIGLNILVSEAANFTTMLIPISGFWAKIFNAAFGNTEDWKVFIAVAVVAPVVEEVFFRGLILKGYLKHYSVKKSLIVSALLFGIAHFNPWQFVTAIIIGIAIGWFYERTDSIVPSVYAHALNNSMGFIVGILGIAIPGYSTENAASHHQPVWFDFIGVVLAAAGILWLKKLYGRKEEVNITELSMNASETVQ